MHDPMLHVVKDKQQLLAHINCFVFVSQQHTENAFNRLLLSLLFVYKRLLLLFFYFSITLLIFASLCFDVVIMCTKLKIQLNWTELNWWWFCAAVGTIVVILTVSHEYANWFKSISNKTHKYSFWDDTLSISHNSDFFSLFSVLLSLSLVLHNIRFIA